MVDSLDFEDGVAFVHAEDPGYTTFARELTDIEQYVDRNQYRRRSPPFSSSFPSRPR